VLQGKKIPTGLKSSELVFGIFNFTNSPRVFLSVLRILNDAKQNPLYRGELNSDLVLAWAFTSVCARGLITGLLAQTTMVDEIHRTRSLRNWFQR
jgi:hypothetical protein